VPKVKSEYCPYCEESHNAEIVKISETLNVRGVDISTDAELTQCSHCHKQFATEQQEKQNFERAYQKYRTLKGVLLPSEIRDIRILYGFTQAELSRLLGWGEITVHRYENGALPDAAHNNTISLLSDPRIAKTLLERNRSCFDESLYARLEGKINKRLGNEVNILIESDLDKSLRAVEPSEFNGFKRFDWDRFENLVLFLTCRPGGVFKTALNKILWYIEFGYFKNQLSGLTGVQFIKDFYGPVPKQFDLLFACMKEKGLVEIEEVANPYKGELYKSIAKPSQKQFTKAEWTHIKKWAEFLWPKSAKELQNLSHDEAAYKDATLKEPISYHTSQALKLQVTR
jgi:putative zinc finger/helix-turn-helix YgiT family protein